MTMKTSDKKNPDQIEVQDQTDVGVDVSTNERQYVKNDPIVYHAAGAHLTGKVSDVFQENGVTKLHVEPHLKSGSFITVKANDPNLEPLFFVNRQTGKKTHTKFGYQELKNMINQGELFGLTWSELQKNSNANNALMLGNRTEVIENLQFEKKRTDQAQESTEKFSKAGRLELRRGKNGKPFVHAEFQHRELNLDAPLYGRQFTADEKERLKTSGELGLVTGFVNKQTGEVFNAWVGLDTKLNKVVTRRENDIYLDRIFGVQLTDKQKNELKSGNGTIIEFTKKATNEKHQVYVQASASTTRAEGTRTYNLDKAKELGILPEKKNEKRQKQQTMSR